MEVSNPHLFLRCRYSFLTRFPTGWSSVFTFSLLFFFFFTSLVCLCHFTPVSPVKHHILSCVAPKSDISECFLFQFTIFQKSLFFFLILSLRSVPPYIWNNFSRKNVQKWVHGCDITLSKLFLERTSWQPQTRSSQEWNHRNCTSKKQTKKQNIPKNDL